MSYVINRSFAKRDAGKIADVTFEAPAGKYLLDGKELPESSVRHLLTFALQTLQDAYAGEKDLDGATGAFMGKYDKLVNGTIGTRSAGEGAGAETLIARSLVRKMLKAQYGATSPEWKAFIGLPDADQLAKLDELAEANADALAPEIAAEIARREEAAKAKAALGGKIKFSL